jgi:hypothetical protein
MWIVVVVEHYYPSVFHFDNKEEAFACYQRQVRYGHAVHLAKTVYSKYDKDIYEFDESNIESLDVEWYTSK